MNGNPNNVEILFPCCFLEKGTATAALWIISERITQVILLKPCAFTDVC